MLDENAAAKVASLVASAKTVAAVVNLARADSRHATAPEDWDANPWALNTPDGIIDLSNGQMRPHDRAALCSKMTAVAPAGSDCPRWQRFLHQVTDGEAELTSFLRRIAGYGLTGSTCEHALFFLNGTGANGMHDAGRDFQAAFILAQLDPLRALPVLRVPGTGREPDLNERQLHARRRVHEAMQVLGGHAVRPAPGPGTCWAARVRSESGRCGRAGVVRWSARTGQGILIAALGILVAHVGYGEARRAS